MGLDSLFVSVGFAILLFVSLYHHREKMFVRDLSDWVVDLISLNIQGWAIPLVQTFCLVPIWGIVLSDFESSLILPWWVSFLIPLTVVDYIYYWNHRILHKRSLWWVHIVHHQATTMDILATSRNRIYSSFLICYVWINSLLIFALADAKYYLLGFAVSSLLDLWRHSKIRLPLHIEALLGSFLILPNDHEWHHAENSVNVNFGANLNFWDRLHGTFYRTHSRVKCFGLGSKFTAINSLFGWKAEEAS